MKTEDRLWNEPLNEAMRRRLAKELAQEFVPVPCFRDEWRRQLQEAILEYNGQRRTENDFQVSVGREVLVGLPRPFDVDGDEAEYYMLLHWGILDEKRFDSIRKQLEDWLAAREQRELTQYEAYHVLVHVRTLGELQELAPKWLERLKEEVGQAKAEARRRKEFLDSQCVSDVVCKLGGRDEV